MMVPMNVTPICPSLKPIITNGSHFNLSTVSFDLRNEMRNRNVSKLHMISYGDERFRNSSKRIAQEAEEFGLFQSINVYSAKNLSGVVTGFFRTLLSFRRGGGYYFWKPIIIRDALHRVEYGEYVVYVDSGSKIVNGTHQRRRLLEYIYMLENSEHSVLCQYAGRNFSEAKFNSGRVLEAFGLQNATEMLRTEQIASGFVIYKKDEKVLNMLDNIIRLLFYDPFITTDMYQKRGANKEFIVNRHDQSLLSLSFKCHGVIIIQVKDPGCPVAHTRIRN